MELPKYDPAIAANILSALAFIISFLGYRLSKKADEARKAETKADVTATALPLAQWPGWYQIDFSIRNTSPGDLEISTVNTWLPLNARGVTHQEATESTPSGDLVLAREPPAERARRRIFVEMTLAPAGSKTGLFGRASDVANFSLYFLARRTWANEDLLLSISFLRRKSDILRREQYMSHQKIKLPTNITD